METGALTLDQTKAKAISSIDVPRRLCPTDRLGRDAISRSWPKWRLGSDSTFRRSAWGNQLQ